MTLDQFEKLTKNRRATRHFQNQPVPQALLKRLVEIARWAPSGYNLQPTNFVIVTDPEVKKRLHPACLKQSQILEAPAVIALTGDREVVKNQFEKIIAQDLAIGAINQVYEAKLKMIVPLAFEQGPLGIGWLSKVIFSPMLHWMRPTPGIPAVEKRYWLAKQVMLAAMNLMLAAQAAGLQTSPMEGFDEARVKRVLRIPRSHIVAVVIAIGYGAPQTLKKSRLPVQDITHINGW